MHAKRFWRLAVGVVSIAAMVMSPAVAQADPAQGQVDDSQTQQQTVTGQDPADGKGDANQGDAHTGDGNKTDGNASSGTQNGAENGQDGQNDQQGDDAAKSTDGTQGNDDSSKSASTDAPALPEPQGEVDHKPALARMLAYNSKVDTWTDEVRADFVVRVAHGDVDPNAVPLATASGNTGRDAAGKTGLLFYYSWNLHDDSSESFSRAAYMNTLGTASDSQAAKQVAAEQWAKNVDCYYTIHSVTTSASGKYDYLSVSLEGDVDYPDFSGNGGEYQLGGAPHQQKIYAVVGQGINEVNACRGLGFCTVGTRKSLFDPAYATNMAAGYDINGYNPWCKPGEKNNSAKCSGPVAHVGYDNTAKLWSGGQANWGMETTNGFNSSAAQAPAGTAPAKSFFAAWGNPGYEEKSNPCGRTSTFYYEWLGLRDGKWVPVTGINTKALASNGQKPQTTGDANDVSYNAPLESNPDRTIMGDGDAQNADGSIDFAKAKQEQGLDGYFKLVSWPTSTDRNGNINGCIADSNASNTMRKVYNPLYGNENGISEYMAANDPSKVDELMAEGWTLDTAFEGYNFNESAPSDAKAVPFKVDSRHTKATGLAASDHKPQMVKMLAYNNKVDTWNDELRADFVMRVAHGDVNPNCIGPVGGAQPGYDVRNPGNYGRDAIGECGLQMFYNYTDGTMRSASYVNTLGSDNLGENSSINMKDASYWWARNEDAMYTIRGISADDSGKFDYITISMEGDTNYNDSGAQRNTLNGVGKTLHIYAVVNSPFDGVDPVRVDDFLFNPDTNPVGDSHDKDAKEALKRINGVNANYWNDLTQDKYPIRLYSGVACDSKNTADKCSGPLAAVGWDNATTLGNAHPSELWSGRQTNWGLITDNGLATRTEPRGTAPAKSFFVDWYNPSEGTARNACSEVSKYYFQWIGLATNGHWFPVQALTPEAQLEDTVANKGSEDGSQYVQYNDGRRLVARRADGSLAPAQNADGSVDFAKAKALQSDLTGYFKLVTWPVSSNADGSQSGCDAGGAMDVYNPLKGNERGVSTVLAVRAPELADELLARGTAVATAFQEYSFGGYKSEESHVTISPKKYLIQYVMNDGVPVAAPYFANADDLVRVPVTPHRNGYIFDGWFDGNRPFDFATDRVSGDLTLTAHWSRPSLNTLIFKQGDTVNFRWLRNEGGNPEPDPVVISAKLDGQKVPIERLQSNNWKIMPVGSKGECELIVRYRHANTNVVDTMKFAVKIV